ncbi:MAG: hypothetical protein KKE36_08275 [Actinobacteria bacterium]|nr:hypothetical protein [Actinomycetota bacterium]
MTDDTAPRNGPIEGTGRILAELLRTPRFKQTVSILLSELDPQNAALLVRTLLWTDPEFSLGLMAAAPDLLNAGIVAVDELVRQLAGFPPALLGQFAAQALAGLDAERLGSTLGGIAVLAATTGAAAGDSLADAASAFVGRFAGGLSSVEGMNVADLARGLAGGITSFAAENPEFMKSVVGPLAGACREALDIAGAGGEGEEVP